MKVGAKKDTGKVKKNNEDWYIIDESIGLVLVADGLGGHQAGEVASRLGAETIQEIIKEKLADHQANPDIETVLREAINHAHEKILAHAASDSDLSGMGTTVVLSLFQYDKLYIAHVGDSRAYLINSKGLTVLTEDHSIVAGLIRTGKITEEEARTHKMKHIITQCLGSKENISPEIKSFSLEKEDILLLCSDGLTDMVEDQVIEKVVLRKRNNLQSCADKLIKLANKKGGRDNITVVLAEHN